MGLEEDARRRLELAAAARDEARARQLAEAEANAPKLAEFVETMQRLGAPSHLLFNTRLTQKRTLFGKRSDLEWFVIGHGWKIRHANEMHPGLVVSTEGDFYYWSVSSVGTPGNYTKATLNVLKPHENLPGLLNAAVERAVQGNYTQDLRRPPS